MKLKRATLIALIGSVIGAINTIANVIAAFSVAGTSLNASYYISSTFALAMYAAYFAFFYSLYKNQK